MNLPTAMAAAATLVSLAFGLSTLERWLVRRKRHELAWTASLLLFSSASATLLVGVAVGWSAWSFRLFYLLGGILNVPFLALGTVYLLRGRQTGDRWAALVTTACAFAAGVVTVAPMHGHIDPAAFPVGSEHFGVLPRVFAGTFSGLAAMVIFVGAAWSAARMVLDRRRARGGPAGAARPAASLAPGRLVAANALIASGVAIISAKGLFEKVTDPATAFSASLLAGIFAIFAGFLLTSVRPLAGTAPAPAPAIAAIGAGGRGSDESPAQDLADRALR